MAKRKTGQEKGITRAHHDRELQRVRNLIRLSEQGSKTSRTQADRLGTDAVTRQLKQPR